jgi:hypothetical protein
MERTDQERFRGTARRFSKMGTLSLKASDWNACEAIVRQGAVSTNRIDTCTPCNAMGTYLRVGD